MLIPLVALSILQSAYAFAVSTPLPTITQEAISSPPEPTVGLSLNRRASDSNLDVRGCGWVKSKLYGDDIDNTIYPASLIYCNPGYTCAFHKSNSAFPGLQGCCSKTGSGFDCGFRTKCYNKATVDATPSLTESPNFLDTFCTSGRNTLCVELTWAGAYTGFQCAPSAALYSVYTTATWYDDDGSKSMVTQTMTTVNDKLLSSLSSMWGPSNSTSKQNVQVPTPDPSVSTTASSAESTTPGSSDSGSDSGSSSSTGAIAGGVVGGLAGGAALAAGVIFFFLRRKKTAQPNEQENTGLRGQPKEQPGYQPVYQPVSQHHSSLASWQMQPLSEVDGKELSPPVEVLGSIPDNSTKDTSRPPVELPERRNQ